MSPEHQEALEPNCGVQPESKVGRQTGCISQLFVGLVPIMLSSREEGAGRQNTVLGKTARVLMRTLTESKPCPCLWVGGGLSSDKMHQLHE